MESSKKTNLLPILIIGLLFFIFGFVTWLNSILIPFLQKACELTDQQSYYVATAFFAAYFFLALPSSWILQKTGTKNGMSIGLAIMAVGCLVFIPAAGARSFPMFLLGLFIQGAGLALLQTASNPYVSVIGPIESAARRISIMGICNKVAGILGNVLLGAVLLKNVDAIQQQIVTSADETIKTGLLDDLASRVEMPYTALAIFLLAMAVVIKISNLPDISDQLTDSTDGDTDLSRGKKSIFQFPHLWLGALTIFMYVGAEVMAGDLITIYGKNLGFSTDQSKFFTSFGLMGLLLGYIVSIVLIPKYVKQETWLTVSAILGLLFVVASYFATGSVAVGFLAALGFANAVMWPAIFPLGIRDLGRFTNVGSALLVMGIAGGAIIPPFYGWLYENAHLGLDFRSAFLVIMLVCYAYILWFGRIGHKVGTRS
ncbi:MAG: glucose/galactose MFS transporter [Bacteroidetes bacterium]|jgi:MFS transporter, FHS family, L-fucose permease|nr:MAG: glucose/galactose MFS transporter [Bacteroidota bacterium]